MGDGLAASNVNRSYSLAATCVAIFAFTLLFLYPRFASGEVNGMLLQATLLVLGLATFSLLFASLLYYCSSLGGEIDDSERDRYSRRGDRDHRCGTRSACRPRHARRQGCCRPADQPKAEPILIPVQVGRSRGNLPEGSGPRGGESFR